MKYTSLLFDLDGTLTDPLIGIANSVKYALSKFGIQEPDIAKLAQLIGPPLVNSFIEIYKMSETDAKLAKKYYREYFSDKGMYENYFYSGIKNLLERLVEKNSTLIVATYKSTFFAEKIVSHFEIKKYFQLAVGSNFDRSKSEKLAFR